MTLGKPHLWGSVPSSLVAVAEFTHGVIFFLFYRLKPLWLQVLSLSFTSMYIKSALHSVWNICDELMNKLDGARYQFWQRCVWWKICGRCKSKSFETWKISWRMFLPFDLEWHLCCSEFFMGTIRQVWCVRKIACGEWVMTGICFHYRQWHASFFHP